MVPYSTSDHVHTVVPIPVFKNRNFKSRFFKRLTRGELLRGPLEYPQRVSSPMSVPPDLMVFSVQIVQYNYKNVSRI
jgi:hypothetical protein